MRPLPVTIVSGAASAGKTALIDWAFAHRGHANVAVIACGAGKTLAARLMRIARSQRHDHLFVEVAAHLTLAADLGLVAEPVFIDNRIAVIDAAAWSARHDVPDDKQLQQIRQADLLVINKGDLVTRLELAELEDLLAQHNPTAQMIRSVFGRLPATMFLGSASPTHAEPTATATRVSRHRQSARPVKRLSAAVSACLLLGALAWQIRDVSRLTSPVAAQRTAIHAPAPEGDLALPRVGRRVHREGKSAGQSLHSRTRHR